MLPSSDAHNSSKTQCRDFKFCTSLDKHCMNNVHKYYVITLHHFWMLLNLPEYTFFGTPGMCMSNDILVKCRFTRFWPTLPKTLTEFVNIICFKESAKCQPIMFISFTLHMLNTLLWQCLQIGRWYRIRNKAAIDIQS